MGSSHVGLLLDLNSRYSYVYFMLVMGFLSVTATICSTAELVQDYDIIDSSLLGSHNLLI